MSHHEKERVLAGVLGTITLGPDGSTKIYPHQGRYITATVKMNHPNTINTGATIDFSGSTNGSSSGLKTLSYEYPLKNVPIVIDPNDNTQGTATVGICYDSTDGSNQIVVNAQAGTGWTGPKPADAATTTYTVLTSDPTIVCSGASTTVLPVPSRTDGDQLTPSTGVKFTTTFTCKVTDGGNPVSDYIVEWHEAASKSHGLFSSLMNAYTSNTAAYADRLKPSDPVLIDDKEQQGYFVRMTTDSTGTATLYLVAKNSPGQLGQGIIARYDLGVSHEYVRRFLVVDIEKSPADLPGLYVTIEDIQSDSDTLDFSQLEDPPYVSAVIPAVQNANANDDIYLILNGAIAAGPYRPKQNGIEARFLASLCYTSSTQQLSKENKVLFVVGSVEQGTSLASACQAFYGTGNNIELQGGTLDAPELDPLEGYINNTTLNQGWVGVTIQLDQSESSGWKAKIGDTITGTAVLTGYKTGSDVPRQPQTVTPSGLPAITADDLTNGSVVLKFPANPFKGWDRRRDPPNTEGQCCIVYTVDSGGQTQSSQVLSVTLNTADQSY